MDRPLHLVGHTGDGCRIARDGCGGYLVQHEQRQGLWQRVANLPAAYATCERLNQRCPGSLPEAQRA